MIEKASNSTLSSEEFNFIVLLSSYTILIIYIYSLIKFIQTFEHCILSDEYVPLVIEQVNKLEDISLAFSYIKSIFKNENKKNLKIALKYENNKYSYRALYDLINDTNLLKTCLKEEINDFNSGDVARIKIFNHVEKCIDQIYACSISICQESAIYLIALLYKFSVQNYETVMNLENKVIKLTKLDNVNDYIKWIVEYIKNDIYLNSHNIEAFINEGVKFYPEIPLLLIKEFNNTLGIDFKKEKIILVNIEGNIELLLGKDTKIILWAHEVNKESITNAEELEAFIQEKVDNRNSRVIDASKEYLATSVVDDKFKIKMNQIEKKHPCINDIIEIALNGIFTEYQQNQQDETYVLRSSTQTFFDYCLKEEITLCKINIDKSTITDSVKNLYAQGRDDEKLKLGILRLLNSLEYKYDIQTIEEKQYRKLIQDFIKNTNISIYYSQLEILDKLTPFIPSYKNDYMWDCLTSGTSGLKKNYYFSLNNYKNDNWNNAYKFMQLKRLCYMISNVDLSKQEDYSYRYEAIKTKEQNLLYFYNIQSNMSLENILNSKYVEHKMIFNTLKIDIFNDRLSKKLEVLSNINKTLEKHFILKSYEAELKTLKAFFDGNHVEMEKYNKSPNPTLQKNTELLLTIKRGEFKERFVNKEM